MSTYLPADFLAVPPAPTRWKAFEKARSKLERLEGERTVARERVLELEGELKRAQLADRKRFADALERGRGEPEREAVKAEENLEAATRRVDALDLAVAQAETDIRTLVVENRQKWIREQQAAVQAAQQRYLNAIAELKMAREDLMRERAMERWVTAFPEVDSGFHDRVGGPNGQLSVPFDGVVEELRADAEYIGMAVRPSSPGGRSLLDFFAGDRG